MTGPNFKVVNLRWWNKPVRLVRRVDKGLEDIGWIWNQRAYLVNNFNHGWIAFVEDQTPENINVWFCDHCGASLWGRTRDKIYKALQDVPKDA